MTTTTMMTTPTEMTPIRARTRDAVDKSVLRKDGGAAVGPAVPVRAVLGATETDIDAIVTEDGVSALSMLRNPLILVSAVHDEIVVDTHAAFHSLSTAMSK